MRKGPFATNQWVARSPANALIWFAGTAVLGVALIVWRFAGGHSEDAFFGHGRAIGMTVIAVVLIAMSAVYGTRAYRALRAGSH